MKNGWRRRLAGCAFALGVLAEPALVAAQPAKEQEDVDVADQLFLEATRALEQGKEQIAYEKLTLAWQRKKSIDIAANLALLETARGEKVEAAQHLDYAVRNFPPTGDAAIKQRMNADLSRLEQEVCRVRIVVAPGTGLRIDGREVELAYAGAPLYVEPGRRRFDGQHPELGRGTATIEATRGCGEAVVKIELSVELEEPAVVVPNPEAGSSSAGPPPARVAPDSASSSRPVWPGILGLAVGGAAAGVGIGLIAYSQTSAASAQDDANGLRCNPNALSGPCQDIADSLDRSETLANAAIGLLSVGAAALVFGSVWVAIPDRGGATTTVSFAPLVTPETARLSMDLTF